jgi:flagellar hook-length control protein FliK
MMSDVAVMPQLAKASPKAAPAQRTTAAMQKAANNGDAPATPTSSKPLADKGLEQPVQFMDVLMAQIAQPQPAEQPLQPTGQMTVPPTDQTPIQTAATIDQAPAQNIQPIISQAVAPTIPQVATPQITAPQPVAAAVAPATPQVTTPMPVVTDVTAQPLANPVNPQPLADTAAIQTAATPQATPSSTPVAPSNTPVLAPPAGQQTAPATDKAQDSPKPNPIVTDAQTPTITSLKNDNTDSANPSDTTPSSPKKSFQDTYAAAKTTATVAAQKPAIAETTATPMVAKTVSKQPVTTKPDQLFEAVSAAPRTPNLNSATYLYNPQPVAHTTPQLPTTATVAPPQSPPPQSSNPDLLRLVSNQLVDGIRSAGGSDRTLTISLNPPELGRVHLRMQDDGGRITAVLKVENAVTRADIEQAMPSIVRSLEQSGIHIRRLDVLPADPVPQEGFSGRQNDFHGGMTNHRDPQDRSARQTGPSTTGAWQSLQPAVASAAPISVVSDSAINIYM